jgi:hypothetical protein
MLWMMLFVNKAVDVSNRKLEDAAELLLKAAITRFFIFLTTHFSNSCWMEMVVVMSI